MNTYTNKDYPIFYWRSLNPTDISPKDILIGNCIKFCVTNYKITIDIPFPSTDFLYYKKTDSELIISSDMRLLYDEFEKINTAGIASLLILGATIPPLTPFKEIFTFLPGLKYEIDLKSLKVISSLSCDWTSPTQKDFSLESNNQLQILSSKLDDNIRAHCSSTNPIVLFSGGVDSSVIASRLSAMKWKNTTLVHCSFGDIDKETKLASSIAAALNMSLDVITWNKDLGFEVLEKSASLYREPFCDTSCVPTHALTQAVRSRYDAERTVLDGTGADGAFGLLAKENMTKLLYRVPRIFRQPLGSLYGLLNLWKHPNKLEYYIRILKRSSILPALPSSIASNPMANIGYFIESEDIAAISNFSEVWIESVANSQTHLGKVSLMDIGLVCAKIFAQKNKSPFNSYSMDIRYPFLDKDIVDLALSHARFWPGSHEQKGLLKRLLATTIPYELVYRKKSGFLAPLEEQFGTNFMLESLESVLNDRAPLYGYINKKVVVNLIGHLKSKRILPLQTYNYLWAIAFTNSWLSQIKEVSAQLKKTYDIPTHFA